MTTTLRPSRRTLPFEPYRRALELRERTIASLGDSVARQVHRAEQVGFTRAGADQAACALGCHVAEIWPEWWVSA